MAILQKQSNAIRRYQEWVEKYIQIVEAAYEIKQEFPELYQSGQDYSLDPTNTPTDLIAADLTELGVNYADIAAFANQPITQIINFHEGSAVWTREYGKDARAIRG